VWSWDISYCPSEVRGQHWYLYLIMDIYSRKIVAWEIHEAESGELAKSSLIELCCARNVGKTHRCCTQITARQ